MQSPEYEQEVSTDTTPWHNYDINFVRLSYYINKMSLILSLPPKFGFI